MLVLVAFSTLLLVGMLAEPLARKAYIPFSVLLVVLGFIGSEIIVALGFDTGLRWHHFSEIVLHALLPILVFESAYNIDSRALKKDLAIILILAIPLVVVSSLLIGLLIFLGIDHSTGFPIVVALLTGAILSSTDPVAVIAIFKKVGAPKRLIILMEGESLFNDVASIVLYTIILSLALSSDLSFSFNDSIYEFARVLIGGLVAGSVFGAIGYILLRFLNSSSSIGIVTISAVIFSIFVAEYLWHTSGVLAVLVAGLILGSTRKKYSNSEFSQSLWDFMAYIANVVLFLLLGVTITVMMFTQQWLAMLIGIVATLLVRALLLYGTMPLLNLVPKIEPVSIQYRSVMIWGGLRGAVAVALALSLPVDVEGWYTIQSITYGVVLFTLFFQAPTLGLFLRKIKLA